MRAGDPVFLGCEEQLVARRPHLVLNLSIPGPRDVHRRARGLRFGPASLRHGAENIIKPLCHNPVLARLHRYGPDQECMPLALRVGHNARLPLDQ